MSKRIRPDTKRVTLGRLPLFERGLLSSGLTGVHKKGEGLVTRNGGSLVCSSKIGSSEHSPSSIQD